MSTPEATRLSFDKPGRGRVYDSILETIGNTPLVRIGKLAAERGCQAEVLAKLEFFNPISSVKDRIAVAMLEAMEADGSIGPGSVIRVIRIGNGGESDDESREQQGAQDSTIHKVLLGNFDAVGTLEVETARCCGGA